MRKIIAAAALLLVPLAPAFAHEIDEYVQAALISLEPDHIDVRLRLTPGAAVFAKVLAGIDTNADGALSRTEQQAYSRRVVHDLVLTMNGQPLNPEIVASDFPSIDLMKEGLGQIQIALRVPVEVQGALRMFVLENHHQRAISAYLVNCLTPRDRSLEVIAQHRNHDQSRYELEYQQRAAASAAVR